MFSTHDGAKKCEISASVVCQQRFCLSATQVPVCCRARRRFPRLARPRGGTCPVRTIGRARSFSKAPARSVAGAMSSSGACLADKEPAETIYDAELPARWYRDVLPYLMAATALHHSRTPLLRSGSGAGQRLRERLVLGPLLNLHGGTRLVPWFEPDTLAFVFWGAAE